MSQRHPKKCSSTSSGVLRKSNRHPVSKQNQVHFTIQWEQFGGVGSFIVPSDRIRTHDITCCLKKQEADHLTSTKKASVLTSDDVRSFLLFESLQRLAELNHNALIMILLSFWDVLSMIFSDQPSTKS